MSTENITAARMCWNASVSFNTFLLGAFATALAVGNGVIGARRGVFFMSFTSMQAVEAFLWSRMGDAAANRAGSIAGYLLLLLQPLAAVFGSEPPKQPDAWRPLRLAAAAYVALLLAGAAIWRPWSIVDFSARRAPNGHLAWDFIAALRPWMLAVWMSFLCFPFVYERDWVTLAFLLLTLAGTLYTYGRSGTWGSMWCWVSNLIAIVLLTRVFAKDLCA